jgi:aspartyl-tRNA(Asn)/glutamyl-tRNA(Gln) amidotransferase subunit A
VIRTIARLTQELASGMLSSAALVREALAHIDDRAGEGPRTFIRVFSEQALAAASACDAFRAAGLPAGPLAGIPVAVKDLCDVSGSVTTAGSRVLRDAVPARHDAPVVARLRAAGAIVIGTTNMTEFAMGGVGINPHYGTPRNPWDRATGRLPGGSSSGSAVAVADGCVPAAVGSDTAGSIQMPAALCGVTGFKPTARRVPRDGTIPLAPSLDSIGPIAASVQCCAVVDAVLAGMPESTLHEVPLEGLVFAIPRTLVLDALDADVAVAFDRALSRLSASGVSIVEIRFAELAELPSLSFSVIEGYAWHRRQLETKRELYDPIVAARFESGAGVSAADYIALCNARSDLIHRALRVTRGFDAIAMPTLPLTAPPLADFDGNEPLWLATNRRMIRNPGIANFLDRCALSIPCHEPGTAPVGFSLMGEHGADRRVLGIGLAVERVLDPRFA